MSGDEVLSRCVRLGISGVALVVSDGPAWRCAAVAPSYDAFLGLARGVPVDWGQGADAGEEAARMRRIADFIAGMTDRYALVEHARLFDSTPELR